MTNPPNGNLNIRLIAIEDYYGKNSLKSHGIINDGNTDNFSNFSEMLTQIGTDMVDLYIPKGIYKIGTSITIPSNIKMHFANGSMLKATNGAIITLNCDISAGLYQIFDSDGTGSFNGNPKVNEIYPEWFGNITSNAITNSSIFQKAVNFANGKIMIKLAPIDYTINSITWVNGTWMRGCGSSNTRLVINNTLDLSSVYVDFSKLTIGINKSTLTVGVILYKSHHSIWRDMVVSSLVPFTGILVQGVRTYYCRFYNVTIANYATRDANNFLITNGTGMEVALFNSNTFENCTITQVSKGMVIYNTEFLDLTNACDFEHCSYRAIEILQVSHYSGFNDSTVDNQITESIIVSDNYFETNWQTNNGVKTGTPIPFTSGCGAAYVYIGPNITNCKVADNYMVEMAYWQSSYYYEFQAVIDDGYNNVIGNNGNVSSINKSASISKIVNFNSKLNYYDTITGLPLGYLIDTGTTYAYQNAAHTYTMPVGASINYYFYASQDVYDCKLIFDMIQSAKTELSLYDITNQKQLAFFYTFDQSGPIIYSSGRSQSVGITPGTKIQLATNTLYRIRIKNSSDVVNTVALKQLAVCTGSGDGLAVEEDENQISYATLSGNIATRPVTDNPKILQNSTCVVDKYGNRLQNGIYTPVSTGGHIFKIPTLESQFQEVSAGITAKFYPANSKLSIIGSNLATGVYVAQMKQNVKPLVNAGATIACLSCSATRVSDTNALGRISVNFYDCNNVQLDNQKVYIGNGMAVKRFMQIPYGTVYMKVYFVGEVTGATGSFNYEFYNITLDFNAYGQEKSLYPYDTFKSTILNDSMRGDTGYGHPTGWGILSTSNGTPTVSDSGQRLVCNQNNDFGLFYDTYGIYQPDVVYLEVKIKGVIGSNPGKLGIKYFDNSNNLLQSNMVDITSVNINNSTFTTLSLTANSAPANTSKTRFYIELFNNGDDITFTDFYAEHAGVIDFKNNLSNKGDVVYSIDPVRTNCAGWICTQSGNPGTWRAFGALI